MFGGVICWAKRCQSTRAQIEAVPGAVDAIVVGAGDRRSTVPIARHSAFIQASPEEVMAVIVDFESYPQFLPEMQEARIVIQEGKTWEVEFVIKIIRRLKYTLSLEQAGPNTLSWTLKVARSKSTMARGP